MSATAAVENLLGGGAALKRTRHPEIVADAAHYILTRDSRAFTGRFCIDEEVLRESGVTDFASYAVDSSMQPALDLFVS
jgi:citronellol/citronellal dehydrogenase